MVIPEQSQAQVNNVVFPIIGELMAVVNVVFMWLSKKSVEDFYKPE